MRVSSLGVARPTYWDRNAVPTVADGNSGAVGPHGDTTRWSVTVAAGKKVFIDAAICETLRYTVAAPIGVYYCVLRYTPSGGSASSILSMNSLNNTVGGVERIALGGSIFCIAGDQFFALDADTSTGGTVNFAVKAHYVTFDA